jgi:hypothetical protein
MENFHNAAFDLVFGPSYAGAAGAIIKVYSGATNGTKTTAMTFAYSYTGGAIKAASADVWSAWATSAALQIATATLVNRMLRIEVDATAMTSGHTWLTVEVGAEADAGELTITAHLVPRFAGAGGHVCLA